jgi:hypothetical protein
LKVRHSGARTLRQSQVEPTHLGCGEKWSKHNAPEGVNKMRASPRDRRACQGNPSSQGCGNAADRGTHMVTQPRDVRSVQQVWRGERKEPDEQSHQLGSKGRGRECPSAELHTRVAWTQEAERKEAESKGTEERAQLADALDGRTAALASSAGRLWQPTQVSVGALDEWGNERCHD